MKEQKDREFHRFIDKDKDFSKSVHSWLAQYDEEDDFFCGKVSDPLPESLEEE